jgi:hypothetical protein
VLSECQGQDNGATQTILVEWRNSRDAKHLPLQYAIAQLLPLVRNVSETSIKPERLKNVIRKKNSSVRIDLPYHNKRHTSRIIWTWKRAVYDGIRLKQTMMHTKAVHPGVSITSKTNRTHLDANSRSILSCASSDSRSGLLFFTCLNVQCLVLS